MFISRCYLLTLFCCLCNSYNILVFFTHPGKSHFAMYEKVFSTLASKGHNLTVVGYYPRKDVIPNYRDVSLGISTSPKRSPEFLSFDLLNTQMTNIEWLEGVFILNRYIQNSCKMGYESENLRSFLKENNQFDLILMQHFISECFMGIVKNLNAPFIGKFLNCSLMFRCSQIYIDFESSLVLNLITH